jgi:hypothetical protein
VVAVRTVKGKVVIGEMYLILDSQTWACENGLPLSVGFGEYGDLAFLLGVLWVG